MLKEFLDHVITEHIRHELHCVWLNLSKNLVLLVAIGSFELLLNESRPMLITTEFYHMVIYILFKVSRQGIGK